MEKIKRDVRNLGSDERRVYEDALGRKLAENQQIILQVITITTGSPPPESETGDSSTGALPDWCEVYAGLTDGEIAEVESVVLQRGDMTRPSE